ncbi:pyrroline-5-carboxylate reductase [Catellatospora sp. KI3]|uniref:pyrroline-5-carboxylate reductase n=1 Tax=Catellatospora sp. KI3 TaxID=3041620 RepID=UPI002482B9AF|nr:pyrroline-5-carboxylate reductase [Catellatospora sp. KI3]MDI1464917.1 pyrroline-5-carboxylate reductase [Catellatospora sp. KI3]
MINILGAGERRSAGGVAVRTVAVVGAGKIGEVLLSGLVKAGWPVDRLIATARRPERAEQLRTRYGIRVLDNAAAVEAADVVAIAVKPQDAGVLMAELGPQIPAGKLVVSLCAGLPTAFFTKWLNDAVPIVRVMTNTPALVDEAMTAISAGPHAVAEHLAVVEELFTPLGRTIRVPESQQDAVTALSGSGPAYFYYLVEAMTDAGILLGLPRQVAHDLIVQTAIGSAIMLRDSGEHPVKLREAVTSPAGTTISAIRELENHAVRAALLAALEAARDRAREIADQAA